MSQSLELARLLDEAEEGNEQSCLSLATAWWQGADELTQNEFLANIYLNRYYLVKCKRIKLIGTDAPPVAAIQQMLQTHFEAGRSGDCVIPHAYCSNCEMADEPAVCIFTGTSSCGTAENLLGYAIRCAENVCKNCLPQCTDCGGNITTAVADFFTPGFHESDYLVVRILFDDANRDATEFGVLWWSQTEGFNCFPDEIPDENEKCLLTLERAARLMAAGLTKPAVILIRNAFRRFPDDPAMVHSVSLLADARQTELAEEIVRAHIKRFPADALGHLYLAEVLLRGKSFEKGKVNTSVVDAAMHRIKEALRLRPLWREALLLQCILQSLSSTPVDVVVTSYRKLLRLYPEYGPAHFDFALYCRQIMPELSQHHFTIAQSLIPSSLFEAATSAQPATI